MAQKVRQAGYGATQLPAQGRSGLVHLIDVVAPRKQVAHLLHLVNEVDATSFITVTEARQVMHGYQHLEPIRKPAQGGPQSAAGPQSSGSTEVFG